LTLGESSFGEKFYQTLSRDAKYGKLITNVLLPSGSAIRKAKVSSTIGGVAAKTIGLGWRATPVVTICFDKCPIDRVKIVNSKVYFYFPTVAASDDLDKKCWIEAKTKGVTRKEIVRAYISPQKHLRNCPGCEQIEEDKNLMNDIFKLLKTKKFRDIKFAKIMIEIKYLFDRICRFGEIQADLEPFYEDEQQLQTDVITKLFDCATRIAAHVQDYLEKRFVRERGERALEREKRFLEGRRRGLHLPKCEEAGCEAPPTRFMKTKDNILVGLCENHFEKLKLLDEAERFKKLTLLVEGAHKKKRRTRVKCPNCLGLYEESQDKCPHCGARAHKDLV